MDRPNIAVALILCIAVTMLYFTFLAPKPVPPEEGEAKAEPEQDDGGPPDPPPENGGEDPPPNGNGNGNDPAPPVADDGSPILSPGSGEEKVVETDRYRMVWSERGAALTSLRLLEFREQGYRVGDEDTVESYLQLIHSVEGRYGALVLRAKEAKGLDLHARRWETVEQTDEKIVFRCRARSLELTKEVVFAGEGLEGYLFRVRIVARNTGTTRGTWHFVLEGAPGIQREPGDEDYVRGLFGEGATAAQLSVEEYDLGDLEDLEAKGKSSPGSEPLSWVGADNKYFAVILAMPEPASPGFPSPAGRVIDLQLEVPPEGETTSEEIGPNVRTRLEFAPVEIEPGEEATLDVDVYAGPKESLAADPRFGELTKYFLSWISEILISILRLFHGAVGNYGLAIILMTILIKGCLFPLTRKQQRSMHKFQSQMKRFQPKLQAIKEKYKDDKQRLNEEILKLYRENGVNPVPVGGCLPMLVQMPIFIGLFNALRFASDLRQATFLYISDLSQPDHLYELGFRVPLLKWEYLNLLPILMIFTWFYQQRLMPKSEDPQMRQQQQMMQFMPVIFGVLFYTMPSGLVLYWMTSTGLGILEQLFIRKELPTDEEETLEQFDKKRRGGKRKKK